MKRVKDYTTLEAHGYWRASKDDPGRRVVVVITTRHLTINSPSDRPLANWSLEAVRPVAPGSVPAIFTPDDDADETVEIHDRHVIKLLSAQIESLTTPRASPTPSVPWSPVLTIGLILAFVAVAAYVYSDEIATQMARLIPVSERVEIGEKSFLYLTETAGKHCTNHRGERILSTLSTDFFSGDVMFRIIRNDRAFALTLPGRIVVFSDALLNHYQRNEAGANLLQATRSHLDATDPTADYMRHAGLYKASLLALGGQTDNTTIRGFIDARLAVVFAARETTFFIGTKIVDDQDVHAASQFLAAQEWQALQDICTNSSSR